MELQLSMREKERKKTGRGMEVCVNRGGGKKGGGEKERVEEQKGRKKKKRLEEAERQGDEILPPQLADKCW